MQPAAPALSRRPAPLGSLDDRSRYRISWPLPLRSATYLFRTLLPAHADHAAGISRSARLRVVLNAGS